MATFRCLSCGALYLDPQPPGIRYFHTCALLDDGVGQTSGRSPDYRDENFRLQGGVTFPAVGEIPGRGGELPEIVAEGRGRVKLSDDDLLTGASANELARLKEG